MTVIDIFHALICFVGVWLVLSLWKRFVYRPKVWVLDDSEADLAIFKMKIKLDDYDVRYFTDPSRMMNEYAKALILGRGPSCVVVDYYLSEYILGDEVLHFFKNNGVPTVIVTGYEGRISNITERDIIYKSVEDSYFLSVENWIASATGRV